MNTIICFRQAGNNLRLGNTLVWVEQAIDWCKRHDFTFWLPNAEQILGELFDDSSDVFSMPLNWDESIFYQSEKFRLLLGRIVHSMNEVKDQESVSDFAFACSIIPEIIAYIDPKGNTDWSEIPTDLIRFLKKHRLVIVNEPFPFQYSQVNGNTNLYLQPSRLSIDFAKNLLTKSKKNIGIHIRQGDYKNWQGGKYYQTSEFYNELIEAILNSTNCANINLFIAHNGEFEISQLNKELLLNDRLICSNHNFSDVIKDFLVLSSCDLVIGPFSTFSRQALIWGKKYNNVSGKWLPIDSESDISDILAQIDCYVLSEKN